MLHKNNFNCAQSTACVFCNVMGHDPVEVFKLAEAFGAKGMTIATEKDIEPVLRAALAENGPVLIDCKIGIDDKVLPMIAPGKSFDSIITEMGE